ncbi:MAG: hypothetical protein HY867_14355 [Chloroflexi bacterium]|nr:hypothetical protein [Chloroflexota bacterium]
MKTQLWHRILAIFFAATILGSGVFLFRLNTVKWTTYSPEDGSLFQLKFSHPETWTWQKTADAPEYLIGSLVAANPYAENVGAMWSGVATILVDPPLASLSETRIAMQMKINEQLWGGDAPSWLHVLRNNITKIAQHEAREIMLMTDPRPQLGQEDSMLEKSFYILTDDRYYIVSLFIPYAERHSRFAKEFDTLVKSIHLLP